MIRKLEDKDIDKVMNIWLESTIKAHDFISKEYWESNYDTVKEVYIPIADSFIYEEKGILDYLDQRGSGGDRHVSALHYRWLFYRNRRYLCIFMRHWIFLPYFSDRSFLTKSGWRADLLCAVLCGWNSGNDCGFCSGDTGS